MREPLYILETTRMSQIQELFRQHNQSIAIVLDEYSGTSGLVTKEDFTQEIFGTMYDEYDSSESPEIQNVSLNHFLISGNSRLFDINEKTGLHLISENYETLAGFIHEQLDELPEEGQELFFEDYSLRIEKKEKQKILLVSLFIQVDG
jgi:CBS domain containing-hemolysin-like protein